MSAQSDDPHLTLAGLARFGPIPAGVWALRMLGAAAMKALRRVRRLRATLMAD